MKLVYPLLYNVPPIKSLTMNGDFEENLKLLKSYGYDGIELIVRDVCEGDGQYLKEITERYGMEIVAVGCTPAVSLDGLTLMSEDESIAAEALRRSERFIELAAFLKAPFFIGVFRGKIGHLGESGYNALQSKFAHLAEYAKKCGADIAIEPQSKAGVDSIHTVREALDFIEQIGADNMGILYDFCHAEAMEPDWIEAIKIGGDKIMFVHCTDRKRTIPGTGGMDINASIKALKQIEYSGAISLEVYQVPDSHSVAKLSAMILRHIEHYCL